MNKQKFRRKAKRRATKHMDEAWECFLADNLPMALKLARQATLDIPNNPRIWCDFGSLLIEANEPTEAEKALRFAISLAPTYAQAFAKLALIQARAGKLPQAVRLQSRAFELAPDDAEAQQMLAGYQAMDSDAPFTYAPSETKTNPPAPFTDRTNRYDWSVIANELADKGAVRLPELLTTKECDALAGFFFEGTLFEHEVAINGEAGQVEYRFFTQPLPGLVMALRTELYARLAPISNHWQELTHREERFPAHLEGFLAHCRRLGQHKSAAILLRYPVGGFNALHQDLAGNLAFPLQLAVTLGPGNSLDGDGGEFELSEHRRKGRRTTRIATAIGDGVVFCSQARLVSIAGAYGWQMVHHGIAEVGKERFALGIPFHDYA